MTKIKEGHLGKITIKDHIVLCGFSTCSGKVINELIQSKKSENIVLVTEKENPDISGIIYYHGDYSDINVLRQINVKDAKMCIVFSEFQEHDTIKSVDLRTVLTVFNVESENKNIHTIAEIINQENGVLIKDRVDGDEIIFKETIDANLICNCIRHPYLSPVVYDLLNVDDHVLEEGRLVDFGLSSPCEFKEIRIKMIEKDITLLGVIFADEREPKLSPKNSEIITANDRLLFIKS